MIIISIGSYLFYQAGTNGSYSFLLFAATLLGLGLGGLGITMNVMVGEGSLPENRRQFLSGLHGVYGVSSFIAPQLLNVTLKLGGSWLDFFRFVSFIGVPILIYSFFVKDKHRSFLKESGTKFPVSVSNRLIIGSFFGLYVASEIIISSRLTLYLTRVKNLSLEQSNLYLSLFFIFLMTGRLFVAFKKLKVENDRLLILSSIATFITFSFGIFLHPFFLSLCGLTMSYFFPVSMDWLGQKFHKANHIMVSSVMASIGILLSVMHYVFGMISDNFGVDTAFYLFYFLNIGALFFFIKSEGVVNEIKQQAS